MELRLERGENLRGPLLSVRRAIITAESDRVVKN
jgi:hypothetical protein